MENRQNPDFFTLLIWKSNPSTHCRLLRLAPEKLGRCLEQSDPATAPKMRIDPMMRNMPFFESGSECD